MDQNGDEAALLRSVHASRGEATPRLIYADWLDDAGRPQEAAMHRYIADPSERHRDLFVEQHGGDASRAAFVLSNHAYDRTQHHHDAGNLRTGVTGSEPAQAWNAVRTAHAATDAYGGHTGGRIRSHNSAAAQHEGESRWYDMRPIHYPHGGENEHEASAELHAIHNAANKLHRHATTALRGY